MMAALLAQQATSPAVTPPAVALGLCRWQLRHHFVSGLHQRYRQPFRDFPLPIAKGIS